MKPNADYEELIQKEEWVLYDVDEEYDDERRKLAFRRVANAFAGGYADSLRFIQEVTDLCADLEIVSDGAVLRMEASESEYYVAHSIDVPNGTAYIVSDFDGSILIQSEKETKQDVRDCYDVVTNRVDWLEE